MITVTCEKCQRSIENRSLGQLRVVSGWELELLGKFPQLCPKCLRKLSPKTETPKTISGSDILNGTCG